jgi:hypothetical protein
MIAPVDFILSLSVVFAVIIGIVRFKRIDSSYYPFIYSISCALLMEIIHQVLMSKGWNHALITTLNVYLLIDFFLYTWLFYNWGLFNRGRPVFVTVIATSFVVWLITLYITNQGNSRLNVYFIILYAFALIFFSVNMFNRAIVHERMPIFKNARFWICLGIIIFYSFFIVSNAGRLSIFIRPNYSLPFWRRLNGINVYSNLLVNILYAVAALWIPRKKKFTTLF